MTREQLEQAAREADEMCDRRVGLNADATWALTAAVYRIGALLVPLAIEAEQRALPATTVKGDWRI